MFVNDDEGSNSYEFLNFWRDPFQAKVAGLNGLFDSKIITCELNKCLELFNFKMDSILMIVGDY